MSLVTYGSRNGAIVASTGALAATLNQELIRKGANQIIQAAGHGASNLYNNVANAISNKRYRTGRTERTNEPQTNKRARTNGKKKNMGTKTGRPYKPKGTLYKKKGRSKRTKKRYTKKTKKRTYKRKRKAIKYPSFSKYGVTLQYEQGGTATGEGTIYVAHGTRPLDHRATIFHALLMKLLLKAGIRIDNWNESTRQWYKVEIVVRSNGGTTTRIQAKVDPGQDWGDLANAMQIQWVSSFNTAYTAGAVIADYTFLYATMYNNMNLLANEPDSNVTELWDKQSQVQLNKASIIIHEEITVNYQNQTAGDTTLQTDTVNSNPIFSKVFTGYSNYIETSVGNISANPPKWLIPTGGEYQNTDNDTMPAQLKHDPLKKDIKNCREFQGATTYLPGAMWTKKITRHHTVKLQEIFYSYNLYNRRSINSPLSDNKVMMWMLSSFEKSLNTRLSTEQPITIGFQSTHTIKAMFKEDAAKYLPKIFSEEANEA